MRFAATLCAAVLLLAGCAGSDSEGSSGASPEPSASATPSSAEPSAEPTKDEGVVVDIVIEDGKITPQGDRVEVGLGEPVTLTISSDADEEIHVHSDPEHTYEVGPGDDVTETLTIDTPGQVAVEAHHLGVTTVQLVVRP